MTTKEIQVGKLYENPAYTRFQYLGVGELNPDTKKFSKKALVIIKAPPGNDEYIGRMARSTDQKNSILWQGMKQIN